MSSVVSKSRHRWIPAALVLALAASMLVLLPAALPTAQAAPPVGPDKLADFEPDVPAGWFTYAGASTVVTTAAAVADSDPLARPAQSGDNGVGEVDFDITDFGGFGQDVNEAFGGPQNWSTTDGFSFWFYGTGSGLAYQAEISDNRSDPNTDTSERFDYTFTDSTPGWQPISIPWSDFTRATDFQPAGAPDDGFTLTEIWAWAIVLPQGVDTVYFDDIGLDNRVVDDFEEGLPSGTDTSTGVALGFFTFQDGPDSSVGMTASATAPETFEFGSPNSALQLDMKVASFAGMIHNFANEALDTWTPQDWSAYEGFAFWLHGENTGTDLFIDLIENRTDGSTGDDAERWSIALVDDFSGWQYFEVPFEAFFRKDIGNGAPNDGFTRQEMHGYAFGALNTAGATHSWYLDGVSVYGDAGSIPLTVAFTDGVFGIEEGTTGNITVKLNRAMVEGDPAQVTVDYTTEPAVAIPDRDYTPVSGTLTFTNGESQELSFDLETFDNTKHEGDKRIILRLSNPTDVELGFIRQSSALITDNDPYDPNLLDDFEQFPYLWDTTSNVTLSNPEVAAGDPLEVPGQGAYEGILEATVPIHVDAVALRRTCTKSAFGVAVLSSESFDATTIDHTTVSLDGATEIHLDRKTGLPVRHERDVNRDGVTDLVFHFPLTPECDQAAPISLNGSTFDGQPVTSGGSGASFGRDFPLGEDWSGAESVGFWYYGSGGGEKITVEVKDNRAPDPGPAGWDMVWSDEFDEPAGTPPNPANWGYEIGDVTPDGKNGWGNEERQYYTDDPANAATDGDGNLVITLEEADGSLECYYGTCEYTSARLLSAQRQEFAYGRIESRLKVPEGGGLWPAFWSLGTDIDRNPWPAAGEIDFMEFVGRLPNEIFGTIHGPGYAGGASFGNIYEFGEPVFNDYHTFTVEWQPEQIDWYVDGILYHSATPADVAPNEWVFEKPFFLLLNLAIGGNFGGAIDPDIDLPQSLAVDYVRVYQGPDTAERFETTFVDDFVGWQEVTIPLEGLVRSAEQPYGAPDDGLTLTDVWGYGFAPDAGNATGSMLLDQVRLVPFPPPTEIIVTSLANSGTGSLRAAVADIAAGGTITFDPSLAGGTVNLNGPISVMRDVTINADAAPGLSLDGQGTDRVLVVEPEVSATVANLTMTNGFGFQLAGGVLNNGDLVLDHVTVAGNDMTTDAGDFWQGGGGIYNGEGATLHLVDSAVIDNSSGWAGGGVFSFLNTTTTVERSTISGNVAADVGGGMRSLGNAEVVNSTLSGNESIGWYGGAAFITDGVVTMTNSTVADNVSAAGGPAALFVGTFGDSAATLNLVNTIVSGNATEGCFAGFFGAGAVTLASGGGNLASDGTCNLTGTGDQPNTDPLLGPLAANGGPTETHALLPGSPAIDAADTAACPPVDQRGVTRDAACDVGAFEYVP